MAGKRCVGFGLLFIGMTAPGLAQPPTSSFETCIAQVSAIEELNIKFSEHCALGGSIVHDRQETLASLSQTRQRVGQFAEIQRLNSLALLQSQLTSLSIQAELNALVAVKNGQSPRVVDTNIYDPRYDPKTSFGFLAAQSNQLMRSQEMKSLGSVSAAVQVEADAILHEMKTTDAAGRLAVQRYVSLMHELEKTVKEMTGWEQKAVALFNRYWEIADVAGIQSNLELRTSLRELEKASDQNAGAMFARAIALMRLERYEEALLLFNQLVEVPAIHAIAYGARAEAYYRLGKKREAAASLQKTLPIGLTDARVRIQRAQAFAATGELRHAETEWEAVLKLGGHEIAARRAIALINASLPGSNDRNTQKAVENAFLAAELAGDDWSCVLAVALASAARGDMEKAVESATKAANLAVGENQALCDHIAEQIQAGAPQVCWKF